LDLARWSARLWRELGAELGVDDIELEGKGSLVVAADEASATGLATFAESQSAAGVSVEPVAASELSSFEPQIADGLLGGAYYPEDQQVQPVRAAAARLRAARRRGAVVRFGVRVSGIRTDGRGAVAGVLTDSGPLGADVVVNAAGTWGGSLSERFGAPVPVLPRRGFILVTEPLPPVVRHKVYSADYTANVASSDAGLQTSVVVEATKAGTVLIGASRERVGFSPGVDYQVVRVLAAQAVRLFPVLADISLLRVYRGFRPYCPDHLPVIGPDPRVAGLVHACGHEGAGIGLAPATGALIADLLAGRTPELDPTPFRPGRFAEMVGVA
jgi:glycine/D-amino acid oxidase-like deaminating enzyme